MSLAVALAAGSNACRFWVHARIRAKAAAEVKAAEETAAAAAAAADAAGEGQATEAPAFSAPAGDEIDEDGCIE
eukprot:COSAG02_NODE_4822_length_4938_cov_3.900393_2_plen_74_part_00